MPSLELIIVIIGAVIFFIVLRQYEKKYDKLQAQIEANRIAMEDNKKRIEENKKGIEGNMLNIDLKK
jgi:uncharacterized membrane-anchored protein YhcB (DUF1043 family)